ncbi:MAG: glycosyltransferase [Candidatus Jettenia sp.]|nr:MAG: glycosyltransferase [Candidatus Jettenia sp.]
MYSAMVNLILLSICISSAIIWLVLLLLPVRWRMSERWEAANDLHTSISKWPSLSVIVPARNERASLPLTLPSWLEQDYQASEIVIIDDQSNDGTAKYASDSAARSNRMVRILNGSTPPPGWTGKLWALEQGVRSSSGEWLLFTDADILHRPNLWRGLMAKALTEQRAMVSLMALLDTTGMWARLLIPAFVYFFHLLYPFGKVKDPHSSISAAAGGCILISRHALDKIGGIAGYCNAWIDDIALAKQIKRAGFSVSLALTRSAISIRPYRQLQDVWRMVARTAFSQLRRSWLSLMGTVLGLTVIFLAPIGGIFRFFTGTVSSWTAILSCITLLMMATTYTPTLRFFNLSLYRAFILPFTGALYVAMTISSAINHLLGQYEWRGARTEIVTNDHDAK